MPSSAKDLTIKESDNTIVRSNFFIVENLSDKPTAKKSAAKIQVFVAILMVRLDGAGLGSAGY